MRGAAATAALAMWLTAVRFGTAKPVGRGARMQRVLETPAVLPDDHGSIHGDARELHSIFKEDAWDAVDVGKEQESLGVFDLTSGRGLGDARALESLNAWGPQGYSMAEDRPWCYFDAAAGPAYCPKPGQ